MRITSYRDLEAWQRAMELAEATYVLTRTFPRDERFALTMQLRRAVVGIASNIAEGHQQPTAVYRRYLQIARGCQAECATQLELARRLRLAPLPQLAPTIELTARVGQLLNALLRSLPRTKSDRTRPGPRP